MQQKFSPSFFSLAKGFYNSFIVETPLTQVGAQGSKLFGCGLQSGVLAADEVHIKFNQVFVHG
ncbi:hypothetical protein A0257_00685 [Hymenobacter psoromatis]|nr:hypothetical protein A0257_00685 [Hymenobacter psoromatis]